MRLALVVTLTFQLAFAGPANRLENFRAKYESAKSWGTLIDSLRLFASDKDKKYLHSLLAKNRDLPPIKITGDSVVFEIPGSPIAVTLVDPDKGEFKINDMPFWLNTAATAKENVQEIEKLLKSKKKSALNFQIIPEAQALVVALALAGIAALATYAIASSRDEDPDTDPDFVTDEDWCKKETATNYERIGQTTGMYRQRLGGIHTGWIRYDNFVEKKCKPSKTHAKCNDATRILACYANLHEKIKTHWRYNQSHEDDYQHPGSGHR